MVFVFSMIRPMGAKNEQKTAAKPEKVLLDIAGTSHFGKVTVRQKITHPDFANPQAGLVDKKGNIYVLDRKTCETLKFSPRGKLLKKTGGRGSGPGENTMPVRLRRLDDKLYIFDYQRPYVNILDLELNLVAQDKFPRMIWTLDAVFINKNEFVVSSTTMPLTLQHKFFVFSLDGKMKSMEVKIDDYSVASATKGNRLNLMYPPLLSIDDKTGELWTGEIVTYRIEGYGKNFKKQKILDGNIPFRLEERKVGRDSGYKMKFPKDKGIFINVIGGKIFYGYRFHDEAILDVIANEKNIRRFKLNKIEKILSLIDENRLLVSFSYGEGEEAISIGIIKIGD
jgi:hypothetical protein